MDDTFERSTRAYSVTSMALTESGAWVEGFIVFIDNNYRDLTKAKFGTKKAWHVTTRLGRRIFIEVAIPRDGVQNSFRAGDNFQVCERIFWAVFKSHGVMGRYKLHNFKDDPSVSSELVKFLVVNAGFEVLEDLAVKVTDIVKTVRTLEKEVQVAAKSASTSSNRVDEFKKLYDQLTKRVVKLEH